jgi:mRNA interferase MazF
LVTAPYVPDRGDVVWLDFTPQAGREQAGRRPALVLSPALYNSKVSLMLCCPLTNQAKGYPFEVPVVPAAGSAGAKVTGVVLADQVRNLDWRQRNAQKIGAVTPQCVLGVSNKIKALIP